MAYTAHRTTQAHRSASTCLNCKQPYVAGNWKWSMWQCSPCTKAGVTPDAYRIKL
jgi:hypothetical protein